MSLNINWSNKLCMPPIFVCFTGYTLFSLFIFTLTNIYKDEIFISLSIKFFFLAHFLLLSLIGNDLDDTLAERFIVSFSKTTSSSPKTLMSFTQSN